MGVLLKATVGLILLSSITLYAGDAPGKIVRELHVLSVSPDSTEELWNEAELVVHVLLLGGHATPTPDATFVHTVHRASVLEVLKSEVSPECAMQAAEVASCAPIAGREMTFLQAAGEAETDAAVLRIVDAVPFKPGTEYVLFLRWHSPLKNFIATYGASGMFEIRDGRVQASAEWVRSSHSGKPAAKFIEELRRKSTAN